MKPLVSVIIPTYNRPAALAELLESLARQTWRDFETIIINDCGEPVDKVAALYPELNARMLSTPHNMGHVHARNIALGEARGVWIMPCDDDDLLLSDHIEKAVLAADGADLLYTDVEIVQYARSEDGLTRVPRGRRLFAYEFDPRGMREFSTFVPSGCMYRASLHDEIGVFDSEMHHYWDWDFFLRVMEEHRIRRIARASVLYAFGGDSDNMSDNLTDMRPWLERLCRKHGLGELPTKNFFLLLEEPGVKKREAVSEIVWDGRSIESRLARASRTTYDK